MVVNLSLVASYAVLMPLAPWESPQVLRAALESLSNQTLPPSQIVVSCDGPLPPRLHSVLVRAPLVIELIVGPGGEGVGPVLARGLLRCRHDLIIRADSDDISLNHRCALQVEWMVQHPEVIALGTMIKEFDEACTDRLSQRRVPIGSKPICRVAHLRNPLSHPSVILRRRAVLGVGSYRSRRGFEDYDLWLRLLATFGESALANLPETLVLVRVGRGHLSRRHGIRYAFNEMKFFFGCGVDRLLPWTSVLATLVVRLPLRILPSFLLAWVMQKVTRHRCETNAISCN